MRNIRYLPLAFICGMPGFVFFLPFLLACLVAVFVLHERGDVI
jgi:hypothetical protein